MPGPSELGEPCLLAHRSALAALFGLRARTTDLRAAVRVTEAIGRPRRQVMCYLLPGSIPRLANQPPVRRLNRFRPNPIKMKPRRNKNNSTGRATIVRFPVVPLLAIRIPSPDDTANKPPQIKYQEPDVPPRGPVICSALPRSLHKPVNPIATINITTISTAI